MNTPDHPKIQKTRKLNLRPSDYPPPKIAYNQPNWQKSKNNPNLLKIGPKKNYLARISPFSNAFFSRSVQLQKRVFSKQFLLQQFSFKSVYFLYLWNNSLFLHNFFCNFFVIFHSLQKAYLNFVKIPDHLLRLYLNNYLIVKTFN